MYEDLDSSQQIAATIEGLIQKKTPLDCVICNSDLSAMSVLYTLMKRGISVPEDVKIVGLGNTPLSRYCQPSLTSIELHPLRQTEALVNTLLRGINGDELNGIHIETSADIVFRETT